LYARVCSLWQVNVIGQRFTDLSDDSHEFAQGTGESRASTLKLLPSHRRSSVQTVLHGRTS
jgi:hypothetical protein